MTMTLSPLFIGPESYPIPIIVSLLSATSYGYACIVDVRPHKECYDYEEQ